MKPNIWLICLISLLLKSCANISPPGGGPKDIKAPTIARSTPINNSKNYKSNKVTIVFSERVALNNITDQLIISPTIKGEYQTNIKKNILILEFDEPFKENTTYTLNFRDGIKDVTESNIGKNLILAFSTGEDLDTLEIKGKITDLLSNQVVPNSIVSLYISDDTLSPLNAKPVYMSKSDKEGAFALKNIKSGVYDFYAYTDINKNSLYDSDLERIYFEKNKQINGSTDKPIEIARTKFKKIALLNRKTISNHEYELSTNKGIREVKIESGNNLKLLKKIGESGREINIYTPAIAPDSIPVSITLTDSIGKIDKYDLYIYFQESTEKKQKSSKTNTAPSKLVVNVLPHDFLITPIEKTVRFLFSKPIVGFDKSKIKIKADSIKINEENYNLSINEDYTKLEITPKKNFKDSLVITFENNSIVSLDNDTLKNQVYKFKYKNEEQFGILEGLVETDEKDYIIQLVDNSFKMIQENENSTNFNFRYIPAGTYYLRAILDKNQNHSWDAGDLINNEQPEQIIFYKEKINIRANWEIMGIVFKF